MPDFALVENSIPRQLSPREAVFVPAGGGQPDRNVPVGALAVWTEPERNAISTYTIGTDTTPVPSNKKVNGRHLMYDQGANTVKWHDTLVDLPLDERKNVMRRQVDQKRLTQTELGYSHDFGPGLGGVHTLDTGSEFETGWIHYRNSASEMISAGNGSVIMTLPLRTKAEVDLLVRANQGMSAMTGMRDREGMIVQHARALRDDIRAATDHAALDAIDINAGWPA